MWEHSTTSRGGKGGKGGSGFFSFSGGQDGQPCEPGPKGLGGEGGNVGARFFGGLFGGVVKGGREGIRPEEGVTPSKAIMVREKEGPACSACSRGRTVSRASRALMGGVVKEGKEVVPGKK
ncbi:hypothetical protein DPMN_125996 [Dreissena polymorpha]|uniref:Uncharacterized protein n=1 Tax=Dreissena polymorpha TaxID=45954 RepID=A0A9D4JU24_DREPO|nr:hypothetical protein DPMN_125996 [Dreissena polymorpha]